MTERKKHATILLLQYGKSEYTIEALRSIKMWHNSYNTSYDILLIDNGSPEEDKIPIRKFQVEELPIEVIWNEGNNGFGGAMNQGFNHLMQRACKPDYVILFNNDAMMRPGTIYSMIQCAESDPKIAVVGVQVLKPNTTFVHHTGVTCQSSIEKDDGVVDRYIRNFSQNIPKTLYEERLWVNGCCMLVKSDIIMKERPNGMFDPEFFPAYFEEADMCVELRKKGYRIVYNPMAKVYHHQRVTASAVFGEGNNLFYDHWNKFCARHKDYWKKELSNFDYDVVPRVNIVIPAYNAEDTLQATLKSIQEQTYPNYKIIIVDDGSTDNTEAIIKHYQNEYKSKYEQRNSNDYGPCQIERESGIMYIKINNSGQSNARNVALMHIEPDCKYIAYCDADDIWEREHLERSIGFLEEHNEFGMMCSEASTIDEQGNKLESFGIPKFSQGGHYNSECFKDGNPVFMSTVVHKPEVLMKTGGFDSRLDCIEEWYMWWKMARITKCYFYPLKLSKYIVRPDGYAGKVTTEKRELLSSLLKSNTWDLPTLTFKYYTGKKHQEDVIKEELKKGIDEAIEYDKEESLLTMPKQLKEETMLKKILSMDISDDAKSQLLLLTLKQNK